MTAQAASATTHNRLTTEQIREAAKVDVGKALDLAIAETERIRSQAAIAEIEFKEMSELTFGPGGMQASTAAALWRLSGIFSRSDLVPEQFRGKRENCFIGIQMAFRCRVDPFAFLQKCYIVHGRPGIESQLAIAMANGSGLLNGCINFQVEGDGDKRTCRAYAVRKDGTLIEEFVSVKIAKDMGWWGKAQSLWPKMTDLMLKYRAAMWLIRTSMPEVIMGLMSKEELKDGEIDGPAETVASLEDRIKAFESKVNGNGKSECDPEPTPDSQDVHIEPDNGEPTEEFPPRDEPAPSAGSLDDGLRKGNALAEIKRHLNEAFGDNTTAISKTISAVFKVRSLTAVERWASDQIEKGLADLVAHLDSLPDA